MGNTTPSVKLVEKAKEWYERRSGLPIYYPITNYIRKAGYYTRIHIFGTVFFGTYKGFRIVGSKDRRGLRYSGGSDEVYPEVLVSISKTDFIANFSDMEIVCPPDDPNLEKLETIVINTLREIFQERDLQKDKP